MDNSHPGAGDIVYCSPFDIEVNPDQPRMSFESEALFELEQSIRKDGLISPLLVRLDPNQKGKFVLIAGERRLRACKNVGLAKIPVLVKELGAADDNLALAVVENIQRRDLNIVEEAMAYQKLVKNFGLSHEQCAERVGKDRTTISNAIRILSLPEEVLEDLKKGSMSMGHGRALLSLAPNIGLIMKVRELILKKGLSVRKAELVCKSLSNKGKGAAEPQKSMEPDPEIEYIATSLREHFRTKVLISGNAQKGKIEISYFSPAELERVLGLINFAG